VKCREFYLAVIENGPLSELKSFEKRMRESLFQNVLRTFEVQLFVSLLAIVLSPTLFPLLNVPEPSRQIFMIYALGALCNSFILIFLQVLLYIGERNRAMLMMLIFFLTNVIFTAISMSMGEEYYGSGFFVSSFITMIICAFVVYYSYHRIVRYTFMTQPVFIREREKVFEKVERWVDDRMTARDSFELRFLRRRQQERRKVVTELDQGYAESKRATGSQPEKQDQAAASPVQGDAVVRQGSPVIRTASPKPVYASYTGRYLAGNYPHLKRKKR